VKVAYTVIFTFWCRKVGMVLNWTVASVSLF